MGLNRLAGGAALMLLAACIQEEAQPSITRFEAAPQQVEVGAPVTFSWQVAPAAACTLDVQSDGTPEYSFETCAAGSQAHTYPGADSYTATLRLSAGGAARSASVTVTPEAPDETPDVPGPLPRFTWALAAPQPQKVAEGQGIELSGKLYVFGGFDSLARCCTPTDRARVYDPASNSWTALAPLPPMNGTGHGGVTHAGVASDGRDIYLAGGYTANASGTGQLFGTREVWRYAVAENRYLRLPDLPQDRAAGQLEYVAGKLHYFGGTNRPRTRDTADHYVLDLAGGGWSEAAPLPNARNHLGSAVLGGKLYAVGGQHGHDAALTTQDDVHVYEPATDTWTAVAPLPAPISHISNSTLVLGGRIVVVGGEVSHLSPVASVYAYTPQTNSWDALTPLPRALQSAVAKNVGGEVIVTGGSGGGWRAETYRGAVR